MDENNINRNALARRVNTRFEVIDKWYRNDVEKIDLDILARICFVLKCEVKDILNYESQ
ncbi:MAG: helix-turn-helix transcriptional regulator [Clostridia bacterium]|nr:helix-turn-helix transcriptional regulator [Clostridia bacterium]